VLAVERRVRNELTLHRLLAISRRAASIGMSASRRMQLTPVPPIRIPLPLLVRKAV
jgi:hypothetical protein